MPSGLTYHYSFVIFGTLSSGYSSTYGIAPNQFRVWAQTAQTANIEALVVLAFDCTTEDVRSRNALVSLRGRFPASGNVNTAAAEFNPNLNNVSLSVSGPYTCTGSSTEVG